MVYIYIYHGWLQKIWQYEYEWNLGRCLFDLANNHGSRELGMNGSHSWGFNKTGGKIGYFAGIYIYIEWDNIDWISDIKVEHSRFKVDC